MDLGLPRVRLGGAVAETSHTRLGAAAVPGRQLAGITAVGTLLLLVLAVRMRGLPGGGPVAYDEGWGLSNGRFEVALLTHPQQWASVLHGHGHVFLFGLSWKVGHDLILGSLLAAGVPPEYLTWFSALAGVVMVTVLAALAWRRWGAPAAATAGVFAGAMPLSIVYGHRILPEADGLAALVLGLLLLDRWWAARPSRALATLTVFTFLVTLSFNYRLLPTVLPIVLLLGWLGWRYRHGPPPRAVTGRLLVLCLIPAFAIVAVYLVVLAAGVTNLPHLPALLQRQFIRSSAGAPLPFASPDFYLRTFWDYGGPAFVVTGALGSIACLWGWKKLDPTAALAIGSLAGTLLFFSAVHDKAPRAVVVCVPFAALVVARAVTLPRNKVLQWTAALTICGACLITGWTGSGFALEESGTGQAGRWLATHPGLIVATRAPVFVAYTERSWDVSPGLDPTTRIVKARRDSTVASLRQEGARWVVVDAHSLLFGESPIFKQLIACGRPAAEFSDAADWSPLQFLEDADNLHVGYDATTVIRAQVLAAGKGRETIRIYDLSGPGTAQCG